MKSGPLMAALLMACSTLFATAVTFPMATAASAGKSVVKRGIGGHDLARIKRRDDDPWFYLPIAPSYLAYDYPYYVSRGYYPTHIRPGYIYYGKPYYIYRDSYRSRHDLRCVNRLRKCVTEY
jgi:hypothetical protein